MWLRGYAIVWFWLVFSLAGGCASWQLPPPPAGVALRPGSYVKEYFVAPDFAPGEVNYVLGPFTVEQAQGVSAADFLAVFQTELLQAWEANGLKLGDKKPGCRLTATIHHLKVSSGRWRFLTGRISASIVTSGVITCDGRVLFAFTDRLSLESPVNPGPPAPRETELLLRQLSRQMAHRVLNELLLHGLTADAMKRSANTLSSNRGRF
ncbi:MAG: hypothetical protein QME75_00175 [Deltaproteobacteria bacterium]|nr:hypothetical protein [Deltaproteobacteria bacterium]